jgi:DNA-binding transcriptional regulator YhcF (GntR family)
MIKVGRTLPSTREFAESLEIHRTTVRGTTDIRDRDEVYVLRKSNSINLTF